MSDFPHIHFLAYNFQDVFFSSKLFVSQDFLRICFFLYALFGSGFPHIDFFHIFFLVQDMQDMSQ